MSYEYRANEYRRNALASSSGLHLVIALYDGAMRFLREAAHAAEMRDETTLQDRSRRAIAILVHLQARLKQQDGAEDVCATLSEFYAATLALVLEGTRTGSARRLRDAGQCLQNVRGAWNEAARGADLGALHPGGFGEAAARVSAWLA